MAGEAAPEGAGLFRSLRRLGKSLLGVLQVRLEIAASEVEEQGLRLTQILMLTVAAGACLALAAVLFIAFIVALVPEAQRVIALGVLTLMFAAAAGILIGMVRKRAADRPRLFSATLAEIDKDRDRIGGAE